MRWLSLVIVACGVAAAGLWWYSSGEAPLGRQVAAYRVGAAPSFTAAQREIRWFETGRDRRDKLKELVGGWDTGNQQFDLYLAMHLGHPDCTDETRRAFSLEMAWRKNLLPRWAHYWRWRTRLPPAEEMASIVDYMQVLSTVDPPRKLSWREVLDAQALFELTGHPEFAQRLMPDDWRDRFRRWRESTPTLPAIERPEAPFADWKGAIPSRPKAVRE